MRLTVDTPFEKFAALPQIAPILEHFYFENPALTYADMQKQSYDWEAEMIVNGSNYLLDLMDKGVKTVFDIYSPEEIAAEPSREHTKLFFFPGKPGAPFVMIIPGGAYRVVCTVKEGFPVAQRLNELGLNAFVLSHRVTTGPGLFPKPFEDLAAALKLIFANPETFPVDASNYSVMGFSAGAHLAGAWGTQNTGAPNYGLPLPNCIITGYGMVALSDPEKDGNWLMKMIIRDLLGDNYTAEDIAKYNVPDNISPAYPKTYIWHCCDDRVIPLATVHNYRDEIIRNGVECEYLEAEHGGHGFGLGDNSEVSGWVNKAMKFWGVI